MKCVVFCTTCKGRLAHLQETLPRNLADNQTAKFVVVNYNSQDGLLAYLKERHAEDIRTSRLAVYSFFDAPVFKMAHAKNMAHRLGILEGADILVNLDADNFAGPGFDQYVREQFEEPNIFLWSRMIKEGPDRMSRGISGRIAVTRAAFLNVGGYDEKFECWSPDDKDFKKRLRNIGYEAREVDKLYLSGVPHNDKVRFREYPHAADYTAAYEFEEVNYSKNTIANYGRIGLGTVYRNFGTEPLYLRPLPTRIFGIGMHKTGTTSLHEALGILGFESAHWPSAHWAKAIWTEMTTAGRSPTMEKHYAVCDLPIPLLYREFDQSYPGSKFILTTRDEQKWLRSVRNHWDPSVNRFRRDWDCDPFTHKAHKLLYGQKGFNEEVFLERFRRHNAEVLDYFAGRPGDLLYMNIDKYAGWDMLCKFLGKHRPLVAFPKAFATQRQT
jgi:hypothetical protein